MTEPSVSLITKVELSGDFFRKDPARTVRENIADMLEALSGELEEQVRGVITGHAGEMPGWTGWTAAHVKGYTTSPETGRHWRLWAAVGVPTSGMDRKTAIRTKAAAASVERRWHPFRQAKSAVYRARAIVSADLSKGL